jgi:hypothetical protein
MKKAAAVSLFTVGLLVLLTSRASAWHGHAGFTHGFHHHFRGPVVVRVGPRWGPGYFWGPDYYWWGPGWGFAYTGPYPYPYPYWAPYPAPPYPEQQTYISRETTASAATAGSPGTFWYYCASANEYYPKVKTCQEPWIKVPPTPDAQDQEDRTK